MSTKRVGWCRIKEELVLDQQILLLPFLRDDMEIFILTERGYWGHWTPEIQNYTSVNQEEVPEMIQLAMMMLS